MMANTPIAECLKTVEPQFTAKKTVQEAHAVSFDSLPLRVKLSATGPL